MKYLRFIDKDNCICSGILKTDGTIELLKGGFFETGEPTGQRYSQEEIQQYLPPVEVPNIIAIGLNYKEHAREFGNPLPPAPVIFLKATTSINAHKQPIILPRQAPGEVDYEAELAIVIGKKAKNISPDQAEQFILGYTCANDVTARDCQQRLDKQWARAKSFDTFCPVGPVIETELDPDNLPIRSILNGQVMQESSTSDLVFSVPDIVSYCSKNMTLLPGTLILTGTPPGVGFARKPPVLLRAGDTIAVEIDGIGLLKNQVRKE